MRSMCIDRAICTDQASSSTPSESCKSRTKVTLFFLKFDFFSTCPLLLHLLKPKPLFVNDVLASLLAQMSSQCTVLASSSVPLLELRKGINSRSVNVFLSSTLLSASLIKLADEIWIQSDGLWLQLVQ